MSKATTCQVVDCDRPIRARGLCGLCYGAAYRSGELAIRVKRPSVADIDTELMTCTCTVHGAGARLRIRQRSEGKSTFSCRKCDRGPTRRYRTPGKRRRSGTGYSVTSRAYYAYGVSDVEIQLRIEAQQGLCLICSAPMDKPMIDHDHTTGVVRGILCHWCNVGLGFFRDNHAALSKAAKYVRRYAG